ncbi:hypothetical protein K7432_008350, partial [Basidiobolus ranarum]
TSEEEAQERLLETVTGYCVTRKDLTGSKEAMSPKLAVKGMSTSTITNVFASTEKFDGEDSHLW